MDNYRDLQRDIDRGRSRVGLVVSADFGRRLGSRREAVVQVIVDGADNNTATIAMNYVSQITRAYSSSVMVQQMEAVLRQANLTIPAIEAEPRIWFNPNLESVQFIVPGIIAIIMMIVGTVLTAVTIVKEKEQGTIEQIVSSPIGRYELMIGKVLPYAVLAYVDFLLIVGASYFLFGVTIKGSLVLLLVTAFFYLIGVLGLGILVSTIDRNADGCNADGDPRVDAAVDSAFRVHFSDTPDAPRSAGPDDGRSGALLHRNTARHLSQGPRPGIFLEGDAVHPDLWLCHAGSGGMALSKEAGMMKRILQDRPQGVHPDSAGQGTDDGWW